MFKPLWAIAGVALLGTAGVAGALVVASTGGEEEVAQQTETDAPASPCDPNPSSLPGMTLRRWGDMTIMIPEGVLAFGDRGAEGRPEFVIFPEEYNQSYRTVVDALTGEIIGVSNDYGGATPKDAEIKMALRTISVCPLDPEVAPWPFQETAPMKDRLTIGKLTYLEPNPASGIQVLGGTVCSDGGGSTGSDANRGSSGCQEYLSITSARSSVALDLETGNVISTVVAPDEQNAFDRYITSVELIR